MGAGTSAPLYPLWPKLISRLADEAARIGEFDERKREFWSRHGASDPLEAASRLTEALGPSCLAEFMLHEFRPPKDKKGYNDKHEALLRLPFRAYITTNYDVALSEAQQDLHPEPHRDPISAQSREGFQFLQGLFAGPPRINDTQIVHLHGIYDDDQSIVLTAEAYRHAYQPSPRLKILEYLWVGRRLVVIGFGFKDPWIEFLADKAITESGARQFASRGHIALFPIPEADLDCATEFRKPIEERYHTQVLLYPVFKTAENGEDHSALMELLRELRSRLDIASAEVEESVLETWFAVVSRQNKRLDGGYPEVPPELHLLVDTYFPLRLVPCEASERSNSEGSTSVDNGILPGRTLDELIVLHPIDSTADYRTRREGSGAGQSERANWLLIEGEPGSGKTTLLRHYALCRAKAGDRNAVPLFLPLTQLIETRQSIVEFLRQEFRNIPDLANVLDHAGKEGRLVLLLDGLDEIPFERQHRVDALLEQVAENWQSSTVILVSRPTVCSRLRVRFQELTLLPFDGDQRHCFLEKWFTARQKQNPAQEAARACEHFDSQQSLRRLSHNPLHLTLLTTLWEQGLKAPANRGEFFAAIIELLLEGRHRNPPLAMRAAKATREALAYLAFGLTCDAQVAEELQDLEDRLLDDELDAVRHRLEKVGYQDLRAFLNDLYQRTYILGPHGGPGSDWRFWHRSFQEALTAERLNLLLKDLPPGRQRLERIRWLLDRCDADAADTRGIEVPRQEKIGRWAEPFAILAGMLEEPDDLVLSLIKTRDTLGFQVLAATDGLRTETIHNILRLSDAWRKRSDVFERLPDLVDDPLHTLELVDKLRRQTRNGNDLYFLKKAAMQVGKRWRHARRKVEGLLGRFYDHIPVPEEMLFRRIGTIVDGEVDLWRNIPAGDSLIGSPSDEKGRFELEPLTYRVRITSPFQLAAVPVTVAQYANFDSAYLELAAFLEEDGSLPVEHVTWYEACAFCDWLSSSVSWARGARLPTEEEWEYACRAGSRTRFWSGEGESDLAKVGWYRANSNGRAHPVGAKPANPWGLYDIHGNILEWTASEWQPAFPGGDSEIELNPSAICAPEGADRSIQRVSRGGGYWYSAAGSRSACRLPSAPVEESSNQGFRVLLPFAAAS